MSRRVRSIAIIVAVLAPFLVGDVTAADAPGLYVTFRSGPQRITMTLANGTPVGTTSGAPTVIAPGLYNLYMDDSAGIEGPELDVRGPGVNFVDSMFYGENPSQTYTLTFEPSSTYTWRNNEQPNIVFTFATSSTGGASGGGAGGTGSGTSQTGKASVDIVGSGIVPFRGALDAIVYKTGALSLTRNGKKVTFLKTGRYTFAVDDESSKHGFSIQVLKGKAKTITAVAYVGSHDVTVALKPGRWFYFTPSGKRTTFFVTS